jgi:hypothetical protein
MENGPHRLLSLRVAQRRDNTTQYVSAVWFVAMLLAMRVWTVSAYFLLEQDCRLSSRIS